MKLEGSEQDKLDSRSVLGSSRWADRAVAIKSELSEKKKRTATDLTAMAHCLLYMQELHPVPKDATPATLNPKSLAGQIVLLREEVGTLWKEATKLANQAAEAEAVSRERSSQAPIHQDQLRQHAQVSALHNAHNRDRYDLSGNYHQRVEPTDKQWEDRRRFFNQD